MRRYTMNVSFLHVFAEKNLDALIPILSEHAAAQESATEYYASPLIAAVISSNEEATRKAYSPSH